MKKVLLFLSIVFALQTLNAQSFNDKFFLSRGASLIIFSSSSTLYPEMIELNNDPPKYLGTVYHIGQYYNGSGFGVIYSFRYNFLEINKEQSLSLEIPITLGLTFGAYKNNEVPSTDGYGSFNIPLLLQFNYGNGSTYKSTHNTGFVFGFGFEYNFNPLFATIDTEEKPSEGDVLYYTSGKYYEYTKINKMWVAPVVQVGIRYWNRNNKLTEIGIKYGFGKETSWLDSEKSGTLSHSPYNFQISLLSFLNY